MNLELHATPGEVMRAVEALQEFAKQQKLGEHDTFALALAVEECATNIVEHAYRGDARQKFQVWFERAGRDITIQLRDRGPEFDPTTLSAPPPKANEPDERCGGWGVPIVRHYMDEIRYRREGNENVLRLRKRIAQPLQPDDRQP